jgi:NAD(P)-dependent dehydrogenase (short-subunit alcohol dehydrogenase family)
MKNFAGKTAVVTGAASGIGLALAEKLARENMQVMLADVEEERLELAVEDLRKYQLSVSGVVADVLVEESIQNLLARARDQYGNIHMLCSNAGVGANSGTKAIWEVGKKDWDWVMGVNYQGVLNGFQTFIPHMVEHGEESHLITTVSLAGLLPGSGTYGVSKHAVMALTEAVRNDLLARDANVSVSALCPGFVDTNIDKSERNRPDYLADPEVSREESGNSPISQLLRRGKQPSEIADIVFEAIKEGVFYILPHPAWDEMLHDRFEQMLSREPLPTLSPDKMARIFMPRDDGESY